MHATDGLRQLLSVSTDVLHRRGTEAAGYARQRFDPAQAGLDGLGDQFVPVVAGGVVKQQAAVGQLGFGSLTAGRLDDESVETGVTDQHVGAAGQQQNVGAFGVRSRDEADQVTGAGGLDQPGGRSADSGSCVFRKWNASISRTFHLVFTSRESRGASRTKLNASTDNTIRAPGESNQGQSRNASKFCASLSSRPQDVIGSFTPRPRNDRALSPRM